jgi:hypothetical protein
MMCDLKRSGHGLCRQLRRYIVTLIASQLLLGGSLVAAKSEENVHTASIISEIDVKPSTSPAWCYDAEPAFVFGKDRTVFRYDASGKLLWQVTAPWEMGAVGNVSCSDDGKVLYFNNWTNTRLAIYSPENGLSIYEMSVPDIYKPGGISLSADGSTFALPSAPSLVSGVDVLRNKRVVQTGDRSAFWTRDILFVDVDGKNRFRMRRSGDLSDLGILDLNPKRGIQGIFECGKTYFVLYWKDELQRRDLEWINDRRLQPGGTRANFVNVGAVDAFDRACTVSLAHDVDGALELKSALILEDRVQERLGFRDARTLSEGLSVSRDRRLILGIRYMPARPGDVITGSTPTRVVVLRIAR